MTVATQISRSGPYAGAGTVGPFLVGFRFLHESHLQVLRTTAGVDSTLVLNTDYTVAGVGADTGSVTLAAALAVGSTLTIIRDVPLTQEADYVQNSDFPAQTHEDALDKLTMIAQATREVLDRALVFGPTESGSELPPAVERAGRLLGFDALGGITVFPPGVSTSTSADISHIAAGAGAIGRTVQDRLRELNVSVAEYGALGDGSDQTAQIQAALDAAPEGATVIFPTGDYYITNVATNKALTLDFMGSTVTAAPSLTSLTNSDPCISFESVRTGPYSLETVAALGRTVTLTNIADAALFQPGDYIQFRDLFFTPGWDMGIGGATSIGFYGRGELNRVISVAGAVITLEKPVEHLYSKPDTGTVYRIAAPIVGASVRNIRRMSEIDPGARYTGSTSDGPHLVDFRYCINPLVENVTVDGFQLHAFQFNTCINPRAQQCAAKDAFRPVESGHGYGLQFSRCTNGVADQIVGHHLRHLVDQAQAYDCVSQNCVGYDSQGTQFVLHGQLSKRAKSINDTVYGHEVSGWCSGNPSFGADYDYTIINPTLYATGASYLVIARTLAERTTIINPRVFIAEKNSSSAMRLFNISSGAKDTKILGGYVDVFNIQGSSSDCVVLAVDKTDTADLVGINPENILVDGLKIRGNTTNPNSTNLLLFQYANGRVKVRNCEIEGNATNSTGVRVNSTCTPSDLVIEGNTFTGNLVRGIHTQAAPTEVYRVRDNRHDATYATASESLLASTLLIQGGDDTLFKPFTVATLPAGRAGLLAYASNGRKAGEGAGAGTGVPVFHDGTAWKAFDTGATVAA